MLLGHYGVAFAVRRVIPRTSLGTTVFAAQLLDELWQIFLLLGIEQVESCPVTWRRTRLISFSTRTPTVSWLRSRGAYCSASSTTQCAATDGALWSLVSSSRAIGFSIYPCTLATCSSGRDHRSASDSVPGTRF